MSGGRSMPLDTLTAGPRYDPVPGLRLVARLTAGDRLLLRVERVAP